MREINCRAIVLKKQDYGEANELITLYSLELGKIRVLAKSVKLSKSKLKNFLQTFFEIQLTLTNSSNLKTIIEAKVLNSYANLRQDLEKIKYASLAGEIILRLTPDLQINKEIFWNLKAFFTFLCENQWNLAGIIKYKLTFLNVIGLNPLYNSSLIQQIKFYQLAEKISITEYEHLYKFNSDLNLLNLEKWLTNFMLENLEREIKSEKFVV